MSGLLLVLYRIAYAFATGVPGHVQPVGRPCGTWIPYAMRVVKDMGEQMGYRSLEWNWPKEAMQTYLMEPAVLTF